MLTRMNLCSRKKEKTELGREYYFLSGLESNFLGNKSFASPLDCVCFLGRAIAYA